MKLFAKLKHWQIFFFWIVSTILMAFTMSSRLFFLTFFVYMIMLIGWIFLVGKFYNKINKKHKIENYKENLWFTLWIISIVPYSFYFNEYYHYTSGNPIVLILASTAGFYGGIKTINFSAKAFSQYEKKKELTFWEYFWNFVLILYMIIGVWTIQPKINKLSKK